MENTASSPLSLKVLIVDDDEDDFELISDLLTRSSHDRRCQVDWVSNYRQAVQALAASSHDLCLLDYVLGAENGLELIQEAKAAGACVPIIFMTGRGDRGIERRALYEGAADYLVKGETDAEMLDRAIRHALERARSAAQMRERERQFRAVFESAIDAMVLLDDDGRYCDANQAAVELFGVPRTQLIGMRLTDLMKPEQWAALQRDGRVEGQLVLRRRDGEQRFVDFRSTANITPGRHLSVIRDVTETKRVEAQLAVSERMASMGTLAAGVAHEINNPLAAVIANLDFIARVAEGATKRSRAGEEGLRPHVPMADALSSWQREVTEPLQDARSAADRIRLIVRDLKLFSKPDEEQRGPVDLRRVLESTLRMAWNEIRHRAQLVTDYDDVPAVLGNDARLGQVFLNLVVNAAQAIPEGHAGRNEIRVATRRFGDAHVAVEIRDTGSGIPPETQGRLFEPFFTTKPAGIGTGLGLPICRRIVSEHGGRIDVESALGRGTMFRVVLPALREATTLIPAPPAVSARSEHRGRVLVVDDEPSIGRVICRALQAGHDVMTSTSGAEALELLRAGNRYDVILCDMMMPQMTGEELYEAICREMPEQAGRIVFLSGGAFTAGARAFLDRVPNQRLEKPFDAIHLRGVVDDRVGAANADAGP